MSAILFLKRGGKDIEACEGGCEGGCTSSEHRRGPGEALSARTDWKTRFMCLKDGTGRSRSRGGSGVGSGCEVNKRRKDDSFHVKVLSLSSRMFPLGFISSI